MAIDFQTTNSKLNRFDFPDKYLNFNGQFRTRTLDKNTEKFIERYFGISVMKTTLKKKKFTIENKRI